MRVVDRLLKRESTWRELVDRLDRLDARRGRPGSAADVVRLGELYRSACADLMLAESHDLPGETVAYLHALVGRAHNAVYRGQGFRAADFAEAVFVEAPRRLRSDRALWLAAAAFYVPFLVVALLSASRPGFAARLLGEKAVDSVEEMYSRPIGQTPEREDAVMTGFYIRNNTSIGLQCYAWGLAFGLGSLWILLSNAVSLGAVFGHMSTAPQAINFYTFVTAHGPFELTAIVFSGAAGLRLGWGLIDTQGESRPGSLRREARRSLPIVGAAVVLFLLAAFLEGFVSGSSLPYASKAAIAIGSAGLLAVYLLAGGRRIGLARPDARQDP